MSELVKWSGSKESQSTSIIKYIQELNIENYYEPFVGGGSIFLNLINTPNNIKNYFISDLNSDLIGIYNLIKNNPELLIEKYKLHYSNYNSKDIQYRKDYFNKVKKDYNTTKDSSDFYFIMRTTTNGMPRYNKKGEFNNSCHFSRSGMNPIKVSNIILKYHQLFNDKNVVFYTSSYDKINYLDGLIYLDPPYENTKGMYFDNFNNNQFINWLNSIKQNWILSYDGNGSIVDNTILNYDKHIYLESGNSSFKRILGNSKDSIVKESLYLKSTKECK